MSGGFDVCINALLISTGNPCNTGIILSTSQAAMAKAQLTTLQIQQKLDDNYGLLTKIVAASEQGQQGS